MTHTIIFSTACIGLALITLVWLVLLCIPRPSDWFLFLGPIGTFCAAIPILAAWLPDTFEPLWLMIQLTFLFWLMSFVLIGLAILFAFVLKTSRRNRIITLICAGLGFLLNASAMLVFLWEATTSAGGV